MGTTSQGYSLIGRAAVEYVGEEGEWINLNNILTEDENYAELEIADASAGVAVTATRFDMFGFTVPTTATSIAVQMQIRCVGTDASRTFFMLMHGSSFKTKVFNITNTLQTITLGTGPGDPNWAFGTPAQINNNGLYFILYPISPSPVDEVTSAFDFYWVKVKITYNLPDPLLGSSWVAEV